jgi:hypothetical protein
MEGLLFFRVYPCDFVSCHPRPQAQARAAPTVRAGFMFISDGNPSHEFPVLDGNPSSNMNSAND